MAPNPLALRFLWPNRLVAIPRQCSVLADRGIEGWRLIVLQLDATAVR